MSRSILLFAAFLTFGACSGNAGPKGPGNPTTPSGTTPPRPTTSTGNWGPGLGLPDGLIAYTLDADCPSGWSPWAPGVGRTLVATNNGSDVGVETGDPLATVAPRPHQHDIAADLDVPGAGIAGLSGCCNVNPGASGTYALSGTTEPADSAIPTVAVTTCRHDGDGDAEVGHSLPEGTVAWFDRDTCPDGMVRLANSDGLMVLPSDEGASLGQSMGTPLGVGEVRTHTHEGSLTLDVPVSSLAAAGGGNNDPAASGPLEVQAETGPGELGLPTVTALLCEVVQEVEGGSNNDRELDPGAIIWSLGDCPDGWDEASELHGRIPVGAPAGVAPGTVHGDPLSPFDVPLHDHFGWLPVDIPSQSVALVSGCCNESAGGNGMMTVSVTTDAATEGLPSIFLRPCARM